MQVIEPRKVAHPEGYVLVHCPDHPRAQTGGYVLEHILVVEKAMGKFIPTGAEVHHWNENRTDNRSENLVLCPSRGYHKLLHYRMRIKTAGGNPNTDQLCSICKTAKDKSLFRSRYSTCRPCHAAYEYRRKHASR